MRVEKWNFDGKEVDLPIFEDEDIETNEIFEDDLENTKDISELLNSNEEFNE